ncbi:TadE/TadG family type IV pilus assembly protein [Blastochloris viridis]|uniref:Flp pilus assembly protein TadG n=1 Tax=Blastochloris viridis TaxID=1079 RepID=A0A0H5BBG0_BLAVI|nr:TadE family protein [Blastochloris viridis]ALK10524.1 TadE-like protein [Blastochloris viridis]BAR99525.1 putative TadZ/CpaE protein [Blastochloris viridis]CUU43186.1 Flp pilus assembly protein TadG [Blastochloris viridis]
MADAAGQGWRRRLLRQCGVPAIRRLGASADGSAAVEFAIVAMPFLAVLLAILETGLFMWASQVLDTATTLASRKILTGQAQNGNFTRDRFKSELCSQIVGLIDCSKVILDVQSSSGWGSIGMDPPVTAGEVVATGQTYDPGTAGDVVMVRAVYQYPLLMRTFGLSFADLDNGNRLLVSTVVFKNEPYISTGTTP